MQKVTRKLTEDEAYRKLSARCAQAECAPMDMERKLREWELPETAIASIMQRLLSKNFINEERFAIAFVRDKFNYAAWGKIKISHALSLKGISKPLIVQALQEIPEKEYKGLLTRLLANKAKTVKAASAYERRAKLARFAAGRGFEAQLTFNLIENMFDDDEE